MPITRIIVIDFIYEVIPASSSLAGANESRMISVGSIATGSSEQQFRPCPLCPESRRKLATRDMPLRADGDAHDVISSQQPIERWHGAGSGSSSAGIVSSLRAVERLHQGTSLPPRGGETKLHKA